MWLFVWKDTPRKVFLWDAPYSKVFVWDKQVRPTWWQPWANTLAYYPLKEDVLDYSGNWNNATWNPNSFIWWVANYSWASTTLPTSLAQAKPLTLCARINDGGVWVWTHNISVLWQHTYSGYGLCLIYNMEWNNNYRVGFIFSTNSWAASVLEKTYPNAITWWHLVGLTRDTNIAKLYIDWEYIWQTTYSWKISNMTFYLWYDHWYDGWAWNGKISELIFEDKIWTAQEVADYYNATKDNYPVTLNSLQNINLTPTNEINITPNNNGSGNVQTI